MNYRAGCTLTALTVIFLQHSGKFPVIKLTMSEFALAGVRQFGFIVLDGFGAAPP